MPAGQLPLLSAWLGGVLALGGLAYALYQACGFQLLRNRWRRLAQLKATQRQVYRDLELLQGRAAALLARVPPAPRPAPYAAEDARAVALRADLEAGLARLRQNLRPLAAEPVPPLRLFPLLSGAYWRRVHAVEAEVAFAETLRRDVATAQNQVAALATTLAALARKPLEVQRGLAELQAMAETLAEEIAAEERQGTGGLVALGYEVQAVRANAMDWGERLRAATERDAPQLAIEAEALRPLLMIKLWDLLERARKIAGLHDEALDWQRKLDAALAAVDERLGALLPAFASVLLPAAHTLREEQKALAARCGEQSEAAYQEVARRAWALTGQARALERQASRLSEAESAVRAAIAACERALVDLQGALAAEHERCGVDLDLCQALLHRAERSTAGLRQVWVEEVEAGHPPDVASAMARLRQVGDLAEACRREQEACAQALAAWQALYKRVEEVLQRLEHSGPEHERVRRAWRELLRYHPTNWPQVQPDWYDRYTAARQRLLEDAAGIRAELAAGNVAESRGSDLRDRCEELDQRWQTLLHEGQGVVMALARARAAERQALEAVLALRGDVTRATAAVRELPPNEAVAELRDLAQAIAAQYDRLEDEARHPDQANLSHLREEGVPQLREKLGSYDRAAARLLEGERAALKAEMAKLWEQWEPLSQRLARAVPPSEIDAAALQKRWDDLLQLSRNSPPGLKQAIELRARAAALASDLAEAQGRFQTEREAVRDSEQRVALERRKAIHLRERMPSLLKHAHPQVVEEEWERSNKAWANADALLRDVTKLSAEPYRARLDEAAQLFQESHARARSALTRLVRYAFLEDPEGMREACRPLGRRWGRLGVTAREQQIQDLLGELEQAGQVDRLLERVGEHFERPVL